MLDPSLPTFSVAQLDNYGKIQNRIPKIFGIYGRELKKVKAERQLGGVECHKKWI
jgi:hypothetical protein